MAYELPKDHIPGVAAAGDLSAAQFLFMVIDSNGAVAKNTGSGAIVDGVLQDKPDAAGKSASVATNGVSKVVLGATVAAGALVMSDTAGKGITATTGLYAAGRALAGGDADEIVSVLLSTNAYAP